MWSRTDFKELEDLHLEVAEDYSNPHTNGNLAQTLLVTAHNLHDFHMEILRTGYEYVDNKQIMQILYLSRGNQALFTLYWLVKHHCYSSSYGRIRFLWELYMVVRELNRNKGKTKLKYEELRQDLEENDYGEHETTPLTEYFSGKRRQLKGDLAKNEPLYEKIFDTISNIGSHPNSIRSSANDGVWSEETETDVLQFGLVFVYALTAQYIRTFEDTGIENAVKKELDDNFVQVLIQFPDMPVFLDEDLQFGDIVQQFH